MVTIFKPAVGNLQFSDSNQHPISQAQVPYKYVTIQNRPVDNSGNATSGNSILVGDRQDYGIVLTQGSSQLFYEHSLCEIYVKQLGTAGLNIVTIYLLLLLL